MKKSSIQGIRLKAEIWEADIWNYGIGFETKSHRSGSINYLRLSSKSYFFEIFAYVIYF